MIRVEGLTRSFGAVRAVNGVAFEAQDGRITGLLGPNGAGKSTTIQILTTLSTATSGSASVAGLDVRRDARDVRRAIGVVTQGSGTDPMATGRPVVVRSRAVTVAQPRVGAVAAGE